MAAISIRKTVIRPLRACGWSMSAWSGSYLMAVPVTKVIARTSWQLRLKEQRDDLNSQIALQVRQAWLDIQETQKRIIVTQQAISQAEENMKVTTDRYQQGLSTNTDVLRAENLRTVTHDNFNNAGFDYDLAILRLRRGFRCSVTLPILLELAVLSVHFWITSFKSRMLLRKQIVFPLATA